MTPALLCLLLAAPIAAQTVSTEAVSGLRSEPVHDAPAEAKPARKTPRKSRRAKAKAEPAPEAAPSDKLSAKDKAALDGLLAEPPAVSTPAAPPAPPLPPQPIIPVLDVVWPKEQDSLPFVKRSFVFGRANPGAALTINDQPVQVLPSGAFFSMLPFSTGTFTLDFESKFSGIMVSTRRVVQVAPPNGPEPKLGEVLALEPAEDAEVMPGELLAVRCRGPEGGAAEFSVGRIARSLPMAENPAVRGLYEGHFYAPATERREPAEVVCRVKAPGGKGKAEAVGKVSVLDALQTRAAVTTSRVSILKSSEQGYSLFLPAGVRLETIGRRGPMAHVRLSEKDDGWVDQKSLAQLAAGSPPPRAIVGRYITTTASDRSVKLVVSASERVAYEVRQTVEPLGFSVRFYNSRQRFDRMRFDTQDAIVRDVRWRQESGEVVTLEVDTHLAWGWGYASGYDESGNFFLEIRRPPDLTRGSNVLAGRKVVVDPGHGPEMSAVGPLGTTERDTNLAIAGALEGLLLSEGAQVYMIRRSSDGPGLGERPALAYEARGDLYVSIHNNALPVTADPAETARGYMHFYYHPQSRRLAEAVEESYRRNQPELPDEGLRWGDLAVCRGTYMPAILTESAYMILPEQEERLRRPEYQKKLAGTILEGILDYLKDYQRLQRGSRAERLAAGAK
ncbi:MAG: N-acetylmuramoyl-L-alanine amidase [Elusimicrobia bacterium]|nr:N-acetylmuramoyl-L-alanine amidase [Elusimicrobiota bacterium]